MDAKNVRFECLSCLQTEGCNDKVWSDLNLLPFFNFFMRKNVKTWGQTRMDDHSSQTPSVKQ